MNPLLFAVLSSHSGAGISVTGASGALPAHPRVMMNTTRATFVQLQYANNTTRWQNIKTAVDAQLAAGGTYTAGDEVTLWSLACAYLAGYNASSVAARVGVILTGYCISGNDLSGDSGYNYRWYLPLVSVGLDWCYAGLTTGQRHQAASWLMDRADWVWSDSNSSRSGAFGTDDPYDNYWWGFLTSGIAGLAASGDDTGTTAVSPGSGTDRPAYHIALAQSKYTALALPVFVSDGVGGGWEEGTNYGIYDSWFAGEIVDSFATAGQSLSSTWNADGIRWFLHSTMPGFNCAIPFGDQPRSSAAYLYTYHRLAVLSLAAQSGIDSTLAGQVQKWLALIGYVPTAEIGPTAALGIELLHYDPAASVASDLSGLPLDYIASGIGAVVHRNSWTDANAGMFVFHAGLMQESHAGLDANSLRIWRGGFWVSCDANIYSASGVAQATNCYNTMVVGGYKQAKSWDAATLLATQATSSLVVARGQAAPTYASGAVTDYKRTVVYLPAKDTYLIVDDATAADSSNAKLFRWHCKSDPTAAISGMTFTLLTNDTTYKGFGQVWLQASAVVAAEAEAPDGGGTTSHAVTITLPTGTARQVTLTTIQLSTAGSAPYSITSVSNDGTNVYATVDGVAVTIPLDPSGTVTAV